MIYLGTSTVVDKDTGYKRTTAFMTTEKDLLEKWCKDMEDPGHIIQTMEIADIHIDRFYVERVAH